MVRQTKVRAPRAPRASDRARAYVPSSRIAGDRKRQVINESDDVHALLAPELEGLEQEQFWVLRINIRNELEGHTMIARGTAASVEVHPRDVFRQAVRDNATAIIVAHNHPSGDPTPSAEDYALTERLAAAGRLIGIPVVDHVVVAVRAWQSIAKLNHPSLKATRYDPTET